uniref:DUF148 domain-containing protein n=1 Tax=Syphacia muris TaxID=451379 RepID=A0A0N5AN49_9BILA
MKFLTVLAVCLIAGATCGRGPCNDMFRIRELSEMLPNWTDKVKLQIISEDTDSPRSEIQSQINDIVSQQSDDIQEGYRLLIENQETRREQKYQQQLETLQSQNASQQRINALEQKHQIMTNMSLSQSEANEQIRQLGFNFHH